jgi:Fic family protein
MTIPPDSFSPQLSPAQVTELLRLLGQVDEFKGHWRKLRELRADRLAQLRQITTIESAGSSTRIEGAELNDDEVARVLSGLSVSSFRSRDEAEVLGYGQVVQRVFDSFVEIPLEERYIKQLHQMLLIHSAKDERHRGEYKKHENHVEAHHPDGRREVIFRTTLPFDTPRMMADLVVTTRAALADPQFHPLVCIARFIVAFLAIHPFQDGNGRVSRVLTSLLLLRAGYDYIPYASLERVIEDNKPQYYAALRKSQLALRTNPGDFSEWLLFFLRALRAQQENLSAKLDIERSMWQLSEMQEKILDLISRHGRGTTPLVRSALKLPDRTARYHLDVLSRQGLLEPHGAKRGRYYTRATGDTRQVTGPESRNAAVLVDILEQGGRIRAADLRRLVKHHGYDLRAIGTMHGRRLAHLRRDRLTGESILTGRGRELAEQHLFTARLARQRGNSE